MFLHFDIRKVLAAIALISTPIVLFNLETSVKIAAVPFVEGSHAVQSALNYVSSGVGETANKYVNLISIKKLNRKLLKEMSELKMDQVFYQELLYENERLKQLLELKSKSEMVLEASVMVSQDMLSESHTITLSKGRSHDVKEKLGVLGLNGVVGETHKVSSQRAQIITVFNRFFVIEGLIQRSRQRMILEGTGEPLLAARHISTETDIQVGDLVVTSGGSGLFPKGLPIGVVETVTPTNSGVTLSAEIKPLADIYNTEEFFIIKNTGNTEEGLKKDVE